jgi:hypothetical protein
LGTQWFIDYTADPRDAPPGTNRVPFISVKPGRERLALDLIDLYATGAPGSSWYIGGEPNVDQQDGISPADYVIEFDYYVERIKSADPTARIIGPSILNWDFTCSGGCGFSPSGEQWMREFIDSYALSHAGAVPPVDIWAIDTYPLTWDDLPMTNWQLVRDQMIGFRQFLEQEVPGHADTPIWVTEIASHWAYDSFEFGPSGLVIPDGSVYRWDAMSGYLTGIFDWLSESGSAFGIDRWFLYRGYIDIQAHAMNGYAGIHLFESGEIGAKPTVLGELYRQYATGER